MPSFFKRYFCWIEKCRLACFVLVWVFYRYLRNVSFLLNRLVSERSIGIQTLCSTVRCYVGCFSDFLFIFGFQSFYSDMHRCHFLLLMMPRIYWNFKSENLCCQQVQDIFSPNFLLKYICSFIISFFFGTLIVHSLRLHGVVA